MKINNTNRYLVRFRALSRDDKESVAAALELFIEDPFHPSLDNHALEGPMKGKRAISAGHDLRIVFRADANHGSVTLITVGNHDKVYRR